MERQCKRQKKEAGKKKGDRGREKERKTGKF